MLIIKFLNVFNVFEICHTWLYSSGSPNFRLPRATEKGIDGLVDDIFDYFFLKKKVH